MELGAVEGAISGLALIGLMGVATASTGSDPRKNHLNETLTRIPKPGLRPFKLQNPDIMRIEERYAHILDWFRQHMPSAESELRYDQSLPIAGRRDPGRPNAPTSG